MPRKVTLPPLKKGPSPFLAPRVGHDKLGRPVIYSCFAMVSNKNVRHLIQHMIQTFQHCISTMAPGVESWVWLNDFFGFGLGDMNPALALSFIELTGKHFPERLGALMVLDAPGIMTPCWNMVRAALQTSTPPHRTTHRLTHHVHTYLEVEIDSFTPRFGLLSCLLACSLARRSGRLSTASPTGRSASCPMTWPAPRLSGPRTFGRLSRASWTRRCLTGGFDRWAVPRACQVMWEGGRGRGKGRGGFSFLPSSDLPMLVFSLGDANRVIAEMAAVRAFRRNKAPRPVYDISELRREVAAGRLPGPLPGAGGKEQAAAGTTSEQLVSEGGGQGRRWEGVCDMRARRKERGHGKERSGSRRFSC
jgi:hypothetical protein